MATDVIGYDRDDKPLLLLDVQVSIEDQEAFREFIDRFLSRQPAIDYGFYVDLAWIHVLDRKSPTPEEPVVRLDSRKILRHYDPDFKGRDSSYGTKLIFGDYLSSLVDAWLKDVAFHWLSKNPPGSVELAEFDFLHRIEGGMLKRDVVIQVSPLEATAGVAWHEF